MFEPSEIARERETFRYDPDLIKNAVPNCTIDLIPSSQLKTSSDAILTAFCQLAALRLNCARALISLFDQHHQYVVAESTAWSPLTPNAASPSEQPEHARQEESLWLCGTYFPRSFGVCNHVLVAPTTESSTHPSSAQAASSSAVPVTVISDLAAHESFKDRPYCHAWPNNRFYAGLPLQTPRGIMIGVLCVFDDKPRPNLDDFSSRTLQEIGLAIMSHLEKRRASERYRQADRVARGIQTLFRRHAQHTSREQKDTLTAESVTDTETPRTTCSVDRNSALDVKTTSDASAQPGQTSNIHPQQESSAAFGQLQPPLDHLFTPGEDGQSSVHRTLSMACNIFRSALELDGLLLLDASWSMSSDRVTVAAHPRSQTDYSSTSSGEDDLVHDNPSSVKDRGAICSVLGSATSPEVKRSGDSYFSHSILREKTLRKLLRYFPRGAIWNFDENGKVDSSDLSSDEAASGSSGESQSPPHSGRNHLLRKDVRVRSGKTHMKRKLRSEILLLLPNARSVAFFPIWDAHKQRWFAGGFAHTEMSCRVLSVKAELSYLRAFGAVVMAEVSSVKARDVERSKLGVLNSISHELRSPLHGIMLSTELMRDSSVNALQEDSLRSIEICSRTLLDTIDQILDWTKINNFASSSNDSLSAQKDVADDNRVARSHRNNSVHAGMMSLIADVDLAALVEDVVESVHAGHIFQRLSTPHVLRIGSLPVGDSSVSIILSILPSVSWWFRLQVGAMRRIIMNILGNSLKYTNSGVIQIQLEHIKCHLETVNTKSRWIRLTIADTGCGIGGDYLAHDVFTPFSQEDSIESGAGLGLSVVKRIVQCMEGSIEIQSTPHVGTTVRVDLPLEECQQAIDNPTMSGQPKDRSNMSISTTLSAERMNDIRGLRVLLIGFQEHRHQHLGGSLLESSLSEGENLSSICRDWLGLTVIPVSGSTLCPDIIVCDESSLDRAAFLSNEGISTPLVVISRNSVTARQLAARNNPGNAPHDQWAHFTHHPVGPSKLERVISRALRDWAAKQDLQENEPARSPIMLEAQPISGLYDPITPPANIEETSFKVEHVLTHRDGLKRLSLAQEPPQSPAATPMEKLNPFDTLAQQVRTAFLLVDDNAINIKMLSAFMKKLGLPYDTATNGREALMLYEKAPERYKCVFMDISMPVMNGFDATRGIRALEREARLPKCPVLALTGLASQESQHEALMCGIDLFLTKPIKLAELRRILNIRGLI